MIQLSNVSKVVTSGDDRLTILHPLDLEIPSGQFISIVGPSGSGKSTLLGLIAGLDSPTDGSIRLEGQDITRMNEDRLAELRGGLIGFIFQSFHLIPSLTAFENIMIPLEIAGAARPAEQTRSLLDEVGLQERGHHYPSQLSGGEQQRVNIARALALQPDLVVADEPVSALDVNIQAQIINLMVDLHTPTDIGVPVLWWRSVGSSHTAYSTEVFLDQVALAMGKDPVALRLELLVERPRHAGVLTLAVEKAGWRTPLKAAAGERRGRGVAVHESFNSFVAHVAEVTIKTDGSISVDRIVSAVDCGTAINPDNIRSQVEGSVGFALSAAMSGEITLKDGRVEQGNFDGYPVLRIGDMPKVEVYIVPSTSPPTGIGEPGLPPVAPAVANAIAAATGRFLHKMPFSTADLSAGRAA
jgi:predicted ABC-type transport system involved in lysophospholipase L1 biosynthesis ATPase subunit